MNFKYQSVEELQKHLENRLKATEAQRAAWEAVTIRKKKNGDEFEQLARAIDGGKVGHYYPVEDHAHPYITVYYNENRRSTSDQIAIYYYVDEFPAGTFDGRTVYGGGCIRKTTTKTPDEIRAAISNYIETLKERENSYKKQIKAAPRVFKKYRDAIEKAESALKEIDLTFRSDPKKLYPTTLYYAITEINR